MKAISGLTDPEEIVNAYWTNIADLITIENYVAVSRRDMEAPTYLITRSSRFAEDLNPWTQRDRLPRFSGHNPPRLARGSEVTSINGDGGLPLGILGRNDYQQETIQLERGDLLLLYTDGITEAMAPLKGGTRRDLFGLERLDALLIDCSSCSPRECMDQIRASVTSFSDNQMPTDDQTLIAIRCL